MPDIGLEVNDAWKAEAYGHTLDAATLEAMDAKSVLALIEQGWSFAVRSAGTLSKEKKKTTGDKGDAFDAAVKENREKRAKDIINGQWSPGKRGTGASASSPLARAMRKIAGERIDALTNAKGYEKLKGDERKEAISRILARDSVDIEAEANARAKSAAASVAGLEDLLGKPKAA